MYHRGTSGPSCRRELWRRWDRRDPSCQLHTAARLSNRYRYRINWNTAASRSSYVLIQPAFHVTVKCWPVLNIHGIPVLLLVDTRTSRCNVHRQGATSPSCNSMVYRTYITPRSRYINEFFSILNFSLRIFAISTK